MHKFKVTFALLCVGLFIAACTNSSGCSDGRGIGGNDFRGPDGTNYRWCARWY